MKDNAFQKLSDLSSMQEETDRQLRSLKYDNRDLHPQTIESVTPATKVNRVYQSLRNKVFGLSNIGLTPAEISEYARIPEHITEAILQPPEK